MVFLVATVADVAATTAATSKAICQSGSSLNQRGVHAEQPEEIRGKTRKHCYHKMQSSFNQISE